MRVFDREQNEQRLLEKAKQFAGNLIASAVNIMFTPGGGVGSTNVQSAILELDADKAPKESPAFTGSPTAVGFKIGTATNNFEIEADGTPVCNGDATGYDDIFFPHGLPKTTGAGNPALVTYLGNLRGYEYGVNDAHDFDPQEYYHRCIVSGAVVWHLHWISRTNVAAARTVKFELERSHAAPNGVETLIGANAVIEITIPANTPANTHFLTDIVTDTVSGIGPAHMLSARLKRIASSGTEPATNPIIKALHGHVKIDTPSGSRGIMTK